MLTAITKSGEVRAALRHFYAPLRLNTYTVRTLGHQGKTTGQHRFYWHPNPGLWAVLETSGGGNRSWNCFGTSQTAPSPGKPLAISCEINIPHEGMNRRIAGVFARDALTRLKRLGLHICTYRWERGKPVFPNLTRLLPRLLRD